MKNKNEMKLQNYARWYIFQKFAESDQVKGAYENVPKIVTPK